LNAEEDRVIDLPNLKFLRLSSTGIECAQVLKHITFPGTATVKLDCVATQATGHDFSSILPELAAMANRSHDENPLRSLVVQSIAPSRILLQAYTTAGHYETCSFSRMFSNSTQGVTPLLSVELNWPEFGEDKAEEVLHSVCSVLPLTRLKTLGVYHNTPLGKDTWVNTFGGLAGLRSVKVRGAPAFGLAGALAASMNDVISGGGNGDDSSSEGPSTPAPMSASVSTFLPSLRKVIIEDTDFGDSHRAPNFLANLQDGLISRSNASFPSSVSSSEIRELHLHECSRLSVVSVNLLRELVVDVVWDGIETGLYGDEGDYGLDSDDEDDFHGEWLDGAGSGEAYGHPFFGPEFEGASDDPDEGFGYPPFF